MNQIIQGDALEQLTKLPDKLVNCVVTSPPYWGLRDYGTASWEGGDINCQHTAARINPLKVGGFTGERLRKEGGSENEKYLSYKDICPSCGAVKIDNQIGLEKTPEEYVSKMVELFCEVRRVLRDDGTLWLNLGDSYAHSLRQSGTKYAGKLANASKGQIKNGFKPLPKGMKEKDLCGIPWLTAIALRQSGWYLRQDIIWHKPNPMPESVTDRCTKSHEYIFLFSKSQKYFYDYKSIREPWTSGRKDMAKLGKPRSGAAYLSQDSIADNTNKQQAVEESIYKGFNEYFKNNPAVEMMRNKRSVWTIPTQPYKGAHFATFPAKLITPCILAGCPIDGIVLDPFAGSGTTLFVARELGRKYIGIELNPEYIKLIEKRLEQEILL